MNRKIVQSILLFLLALVFSFGLMYAFVELPQWLDGLVQKNIHTPGFDPGSDPLRADIFIKAYFFKLIGYICLGLVLTFILIGFFTRKSGWAWAGAFVVFLPVFGTFAASMFYLAGLGLFNTLMYPFMDISLELMNLGQVVLIPYWILMWFFKLFGWYAHDFLCYFFMILGAWIFVISVFTWFKTRYSGDAVAKSWLYRISRHPQYLGWILWSYGLMLIGPVLSNMKKSWGWNGSLAWLLSTLIIIGICMLEELRMQEKAGQEYEDFRNRTPFLFPIIPGLGWLIKLPGRLVLKTRRPKNGRQIVGLIGIYGLTLMALSLFWVDFSQLRGEGVELKEDVVVEEVKYGEISDILERIRSIPERRDLSDPILELTKYGEEGALALLELAKNPNPDIREFSIEGLSRMNYREAIQFLITALDDSIGYVGRQAAFSLASMKATEAESRLLFYLHNPTRYINQGVAIAALADIGSESIRPELDKLLSNSAWHLRSLAMNSYYTLDGNKAWPVIYEMLKDPDQHVRRDAIKLILEYLPQDAAPYLEPLTSDSVWEVRFYAKQALKRI